MCKIATNARQHSASSPGRDSQGSVWRGCSLPTGKQARFAVRRRRSCSEHVPLSLGLFGLQTSHGMCGGRGQTALINAKAVHVGKREAFMGEQPEVGLSVCPLSPYSWLAVRRRWRCSWYVPLSLSQPALSAILLGSVLRSGVKVGGATQFLSATCSPSPRALCFHAEVGTSVWFFRLQTSSSVTHTVCVQP